MGAASNGGDGTGRSATEEASAHTRANTETYKATHPHSTSGAPRLTRGMLTEEREGECARFPPPVRSPAPLPSSPNFISVLGARLTPLCGGRPPPRDGGV